jgi:alpha/beta superfamily hydrolase
VDIDQTIDYVNSLDPGPELAVFANGEHFFHGRLIELRDTVEAFIENNR